MALIQDQIKNILALYCRSDFSKMSISFVNNISLYRRELNKIYLDFTPIERMKFSPLAEESENSLEWVGILRIYKENDEIASRWVSRKENTFAIW